MAHQLFLVNGNLSLAIKFNEQNILLNLSLIKVGQLVLFKELQKKWTCLRILDFLMILKMMIQR